MYKVVGFNLKYMKRQLRTARRYKSRGYTATVAETANHYKLIVDSRKWDNLELNTK